MVWCRRTNTPPSCCAWMLKLSAATVYAILQYSELSYGIPGFEYPHKNNSRRFRLKDPGGQLISPPLPIQRIWCTWFCRNHIRARDANGTSSGRTGKSFLIIHVFNLISVGHPVYSLTHFRVLIFNSYNCLQQTIKLITFCLKSPR